MEPIPINIIRYTLAGRPETILLEMSVADYEKIVGILKANNDVHFFNKPIKESDSVLSQWLRQHRDIT